MTTDRGIVVHEGVRGVGEVGTLAFDVTNRGPGSLTLAALTLTPSDETIDALSDARSDWPGYEVWVDAARPARVSAGALSLPATVSFPEAATIDAGETAAVRCYGFRRGGPDGRRVDMRGVRVTVGLHCVRADAEGRVTCVVTG